MGKEIIISYDVNSNAVSVLIEYKIEHSDGIQTISCHVNPGSYQIPQWLQLRKFELKSMLCDGEYMQLLSDYDNTKNIHASLFLDKAYKEIMKKEHCKVAVN